jgi:1-acyl-sn-glycerol-3-phosphate acyltransferase
MVNRRLYRLPLMLMMTLYVAMVTAPLQALYRRLYGPLAADRLGTGAFLIWSRVITRVAGIRLIVDPPVVKRLNISGQLIVSNHQATPDSMVLTWLVKAVPVGRGDFKRSPLYGFFCKVSGMLWIERNDRGALMETINTMVEKLEAGFNVSLYPEGTSSDGRQVLPFNPSVFQVPVMTGQPILPVSILYTDKQGRPLTDRMREVIMWYTDIEFGAHTWRFLNQPGVQCRVRICPLVRVPEGMPGGKARKWLNQECHRVVSEGLAALTAEAEDRAARDR